MAGRGEGEIEGRREGEIEGTREGGNEGEHAVKSMSNTATTHHALRTSHPVGFSSAR
jgi:hypothetical protein